MTVRGTYAPAPAGSKELTRGCVASIPGIEVGEASRRPRIVVKEPGQPTNAEDNLALAA